MTDRPARVRFYFDVDVLGVAKVLAGLRPDVTYPGDPGLTLHKCQGRFKTDPFSPLES